MQLAAELSHNRPLACLRMAAEIAVAGLRLRFDQAHALTRICVASTLAVTAALAIAVALVTVRGRPENMWLGTSFIASARAHGIEIRTDPRSGRITLIGHNATVLYDPDNHAILSISPASRPSNTAPPMNWRPNP